MYRRILLPTDGSALSREAVSSGILFARNTGAAIVGIHVIPLLHEDRLEDWIHHDPHHTERRKAMFDRMADEHLSFIANSALAEDVPCTCKIVKAAEASLAIVKCAEQMHCDLIYMASHGWQGDSAQLLASETLKVLHYSKVPVLVHKPHQRHTNGAPPA